MSTNFKRVSVIRILYNKFIALSKFTDACGLYQLCRDSSAQCKKKSPAVGVIACHPHAIHAAASPPNDLKVSLAAVMIA